MLIKVASTFQFTYINYVEVPDEQIINDEEGYVVITEPLIDFMCDSLKDVNDSIYDKNGCDGLIREQWFINEDTLIAGE